MGLFRKRMSKQEEMNGIAKHGLMETSKAADDYDLVLAIRKPGIEDGLGSQKYVDIARIALMTALGLLEERVNCMYLLPKEAYIGNNGDINTQQIRDDIHKELQRNDLTWKY